MLSAPLRDRLKPGLRVLNVIWAAFMAATLIYILLSRIMGANWDPEDCVDSGLTMVFYIIAAGAALISILLRRRFLSDEYLARYMEGKSAAPGLVMRGLGTPLVREHNARYDSLEGLDRKLATAFEHLQTSYIFVFAFQETIAVMGLVLVILNHDPAVIYPFAAAAFILLALSRPKPLDVLERASRLPGRG